jgi:hypothetical protein
LVTDSKTGEAIQPRDLDQNRIAKANFRTESVTLTGKDRIALKGLFQAVGIAVKPNDDLNLKARDFLDRMIELGRAAGGPPPLAPAPTTTHVDDMRKISGNEQLSKILEQKSTLQQQAGDWKKLGELADKRRPRWDKLQSLLKCGDGLKVLIPVQESATAIENDRLLLDATDHCTPLIKQTVDTLRSQLTNVREAHAAARKKEIARLEGADAWKKLTADEQMDLLRITPLPDEDTSSISSEDELLAALERVPLLHWQDRTNALPARIDSLLVAAIKRLVPKAQYVTLPSATIHDQRELDAWLAEVRTAVEKKLKEGPVIL